MCIPMSGDDLIRLKEYKKLLLAMERMEKQHRVFIDENCRLGDEVRRLRAENDELRRYPLICNHCGKPLEVKKCP